MLIIKKEVVHAATFSAGVRLQAENSCLYAVLCKYTVHSPNVYSPYLGGAEDSYQSFFVKAEAEEAFVLVLEEVKFYTEMAAQAAIFVLEEAYSS